MPPIQMILLDWGDTVMRDFVAYPGPMADWPVVEVMPGVEEALTKLSGNYRIALATNGGTTGVDLVWQALERAGIARHFTDVFTSTDLGFAKSDPAFYRSICQRVSLGPASCIMVGDNHTNDIASARLAGLYTVWLHDGDGSDGSDDVSISCMCLLPEAVRLLERMEGVPCE